MQLLWLILAIVLFIVEASIPGLVCIWFAFGAVVSMIVSFFVGNVLIQCGVFLLASALLLLATRPLVKKYLAVREEKTNADRFIGQDAIVIETINNIKNTGRVSIYGFEWKAANAEKGIIEEGSVVTIQEIKGVTVRVVLKK